MKCQHCDDVRELEWMEGHCCECGDPIPSEEQRLTDGHLFCEFCSHSEFRGPFSERVKQSEEHATSDKTRALQQGAGQLELAPVAVETHRLPREPIHSIEHAHVIGRPLLRPKCTCDGRMQEPDPDWHGCCVRCRGVIDRSEATLFEKQRRERALRNALTPESWLRETVNRLLAALEPK